MKEKEKEIVKEYIKTYIRENGEHPEELCIRTCGTLIRYKTRKEFFYRYWYLRIEYRGDEVIISGVWKKKEEGIIIRKSCVSEVANVLYDFYKEEMKFFEVEIVNPSEFFC